MTRRPTRSTRTDTRFPDTTLFRSPSLTAMNRTTDAFLRFVPTILDNDFAGVVRPKEFRTSRSTDSHLLEAFGGLFPAMAAAVEDGHMFRTADAGIYPDPDMAAETAFSLERRQMPGTAPAYG